VGYATHAAVSAEREKLSGVTPVVWR